MTPFALREIHGKHSQFSRRCIGQRNAHRVRVYDFAYVRCNRSQNFPQVQARRDFARQIEEQLKPLVLTLKFRFVLISKAPHIIAKNLRSR